MFIFDWWFGWFSTGQDQFIEDASLFYKVERQKPNYRVINRGLQFQQSSPLHYRG